MNTSVAFVAQIVAILMGFFTRVVFTRTLVRAMWESTDFLQIF